MYIAYCTLILSDHYVSVKSWFMTVEGEGYDISSICIIRMRRKLLFTHECTYNMNEVSIVYIS